MKSICCCNKRISWSLHAGMRSVYELIETQEMIILGIMVSGRHKVDKKFKKWETVVCSRCTQEPLVGGLERKNGWNFKI